MASLNWEKIKSTIEFNQIAAHQSTDERQKHNHKNKDIDPSKYKDNKNITGLTYEQTLERSKKRIDELDKIPGQNKRKDRVTHFSLVCPAPSKTLNGDKATFEQQQKFLIKTHDFLVEDFGIENVMLSTIHNDEIHEYKDPQKGITRESLPHLNIIIVAADKDDKFRAKTLSSRKEMIRINNAIDNIARNMNLEWNTGEKTKDKRSVEELKHLSELEAQKEEIRQATEEIKENYSELQKETQLIQDKYNKLQEDAQIEQNKYDRARAYTNKLNMEKINAESNKVKPTLFNNKELKVPKDLWDTTILENQELKATREKLKITEKQIESLEYKSRSANYDNLMNNYNDLHRDYKEIHDRYAKLYKINENLRQDNENLKQQVIEKENTIKKLVYEIFQIPENIKNKILKAVFPEKFKNVERRNNELEEDIER